MHYMQESDQHRLVNKGLMFGACGLDNRVNNAAQLPRENSFTTNDKANKREE